MDIPLPLEMWLMRLNLLKYAWMKLLWMSCSMSSNHPLNLIILGLSWLNIYNLNIGCLVRKICSKIDCHLKQIPIQSIFIRTEPFYKQ
jgi:hypothetical protein